MGVANGSSHRWAAYTDYRATAARGRSSPAAGGHRYDNRGNRYQHRQAYDEPRIECDARASRMLAEPTEVALTISVTSEGVACVG